MKDKTTNYGKKSLTLLIMFFIAFATLTGVLALDELELPNAGIIPRDSSKILWKAELFFENMKEAYYSNIAQNTEKLDRYRNKRLLERIAEYSTLAYTGDEVASDVAGEIEKIENRITVRERSREMFNNSLMILKTVRERLNASGKPVLGLDNAIQHREMSLEREQLRSSGGKMIENTAKVLIVEEEEFA